MKQCQKSAMFLFGEEYPKKITKYKDIIGAVMKKENTNAAGAVMVIANMDIAKHDGFVQLCFFAALADIMEEGK